MENQQENTPKATPKAKLLMTLLESNPGKKVEDILPEAREIAARSGGGGGGSRPANSTIYNTDGEVVGKRCGYANKWFPMGAAEQAGVPNCKPWPRKAGQADGFSPKCTEGNQLWSKRNAEINKVLEDAIRASIGSQDAKTVDIANLAMSIRDRKLDEALAAKHPEFMKTVEHVFQTIDGGFNEKEKLVAHLEKHKVKIDRVKSNLDAAE